MNVAYHLKMLGHDPAIITRIGNDERGEQLIALLQKKDIATTYVQKDLSTPTGIVHATPNEQGEVSYEIISPSAWDNISYSDSFEKLFDDSNYLVFGSLICRNSLSRNTLFQLLALAKNKVLDINLRPPHYSRELIVDLIKRTDIVKLNRSELELISGWNRKYDDITDQINNVQEVFQVSHIVVTLGGEGAMMKQNGQMFHHPGYQIKVEDTVGSGDAFLAALMSGLKNGMNPEKCLSFACAVGALVTSKKGAWPEYGLDEVGLLQRSE